MKKIVCVIIALILIMSLTSCYNTSTVDMANNDNRMSLIYNDGFCRIYVDNETGVQYINNGGLCVMVDNNGEPVIYHRTEKGGGSDA